MNGLVGGPVLVEGMGGAGHLTIRHALLYSLDGRSDAASGDLSTVAT